jgi:hypothetical protein
MSKQDLETYWVQREAVTANPSIEASYDQDKLQEFLAAKEKIETELKKKDPRALRSVRLAGRLSALEGYEIARELYPDPQLRPQGAEMNIAVNAEKKMSLRIYDMFAEAALDAANSLAPL